MSLTDKVIRNTYYFTLSQSVNFVFGLILTPLIVGFIGTTSFAIYALVLGFAGIFGLFDMSISSSFIRFISEHYNKKEFKELNYVINTGIFFYLGFSLICCIAGFALMNNILSFLNISPEFIHIAKLAYIISLASFLITNTFSIFNSVLVSLQKMYLTSLIGMLLTVVNFISVITILLLGYGLEGLLWLHITVVSISVAISVFYAMRELPQLRLNPLYFHLPTLKKMSSFGAQMQVSKLSSFAADKYDEYLLAVFSVLSNVTYYNISMKVVRAGRFFPYMLVPQVAPVAAELNAKREESKLIRLFYDTSKYITLVSIPLFFYIFLFADLIIETWIGEGFEISVQIMRILALGQLINMIFSAPGNSIIPNLGIPKYQMYEGLIFLSVNLILSYLFIKNFGISGAALGNSVSTTIASLFVFFTSVKFFSRRKLTFLKEIYLIPFLASIISLILPYIIYIIVINKATGRFEGTVIISFTLLLVITFYLIALFNMHYLDHENKVVLIKTLAKVFPLRALINLRNRRVTYTDNKYNGELISIFIVTCNRLEFLKKCLTSLLNTIKEINHEIIIWDNASNDGTAEYLESIKDDKIQIIRSEKNIGTGAKAEAAALCKGDFIVGIDDDVLKFPQDWLLKMISAYKSVPRIGYLATDVIQNEHTTGAKPSEQHYVNKKFGDFVIQFGPAGGWCFVISREVFRKIGNFRNLKNRIFFSEDGDYINRLKRKGYRFGILKDVKVFHATGEFYNRDYKELYKAKMEDYNLNKAEKYHRQLNLRRILDIRGMLNSFLDFAERNLPEVKNEN